MACGRGRRRETASGGARWFWRWGAPFTTGKAPGRRARARELNMADAGAATTTQGAAGRSTAAAQPRRRRYCDTEHNDENERHLQVPHLAAKLRATFTATEERRTGRLTAAARLGFAAALQELGATVWAKGAARCEAAGLYRPREARLACGSAGKAARHGRRGRTRVRLGCGARREMTGGTHP
jgi:hypothetical protein